MSNYDQWIDVLFADSTGWGMLTGIYNVIIGVVGAPVFWIMILPLPFLVTLIKQQSVAIPTTMYLVLGSVFALAAPPELQKPAYLMLVLGITGLIYHVFKNRR